MRTPKRVTSAIRQYVSQLGFSVEELRYVEVKPETYSQQNECFPNVKQKVSIDGGQLVTGWQFWDGELIFEAEYHGIWSKEGQELDITPKSTFEDSILFIQDKDQHYDGRIRDNLRINKTTNTVVDDLIAVYKCYYRLLNNNKRAFEKEVALNAFEARLAERLQILKYNIDLFARTGDQNGICFCGSENFYSVCHRTEIKNIWKKMDEMYGSAES